MGPIDVRKVIDRALSGVRQALRGRISRADGSKRVILVQASGVAGENFNATEFFQQPGLRSIPLAGMQPIIVPLNGKSAASVVVAMSNGALFITDLVAGETAVFNENDGVANSLVLRNGKIAELTTGQLNITATEGVHIDTPKVTMTHDMEVAGNSETLTLNVTSTDPEGSQFAGGIKATGDVIAGTISLKHLKVTGVQHGSDVSGEPQQ